MPVKNIDGTIVYLGDLASYEYKDRLPGSYYRLNGLSTIYLNVYIDADAPIIRLSHSLRERIDELGDGLKKGVFLSLTYNAAEKTESELDTLVRRSVLSLLILMAFVWIIRRRWKYLFITSATLAANILIAVLVYRLFDLRLHTFALAGITVSLGDNHRLVDSDGRPLSAPPEPRRFLRHTCRALYYNRFLRRALHRSNHPPARAISKRPTANDFPRRGGRTVPLTTQARLRRGCSNRENFESRPPPCRRPTSGVVAATNVDLLKAGPRSGSIARELVAEPSLSWCWKKPSEPLRDTGPHAQRLHTAITSMNKNFLIMCFTVLDFALAKSD